MKSFLLLICFIIISFTQDNCNSYYNEFLLDKDINGVVEEKIETEKYYILKIKEESKGIQDVNLLKNKIGSNIFEFSQKGSYFKKRKGTLNISILTPNSDGGYNGKRFENLCQ